MADPKNSASLSHQFRKKRFSFFESLIKNFPKPLRILDVGGTQEFWKQMGWADNEDYQIVILNLDGFQPAASNIESAIGDACNMKQFQTKEFDLIFSNSVIEHVGDFESQKKMAQEIQRVGKNYFLQTPNRYFPIEPHFLFPFFQFFPTRLKVCLIQNFALGWYPKLHSEQQATQLANSIRLMTRQELALLFPEAVIKKEKFLGLTKSWMVLFFP